MAQDHAQQQQPLLRKSDLDVQDAETDVFDSIDRRRRETTQGRDNVYFRSLDPDELVTGTGRKTPTLKEIVKRVTVLKSTSQRHLWTKHKRNPSRAAGLLESIAQDNNNAQNLNHFTPKTTRQSADEKTLFKHVDSQLDISDEVSIADLESDDERERKYSTNEQLPFHESHSGPQMYGSVTESSLPSVISKSNWRRFCRRFQKCCTLDNFWILVRREFLRSFFIKLGVPLFTAAIVMYYVLGNPPFDFIPGGATPSWWCNFIGRQVITFELARVSQWLLIDAMMLGTRIALKFFGPFVTLLAIQSKGWPFLVSAWALWDMCLLHGDNKFQVHWFYWTDWKIYSEGNSGSYLLNSDEYLRLLVCMLLAGVASAGKRFAVAVRFGRRQFSEFKPRLEKILSEVVLLNEIAAMAQQAADVEEEVLKEIDIATSKPTITRLSDVKWSSVKFQDRACSDDTDNGQRVESDERGGTSSNEKLTKTKSGNLRIKDLLDRWDEPTNKLNKSSDVTINDVLKFKRALTYMDETFGEDFGPADSRDDCILSAHNVYNNLRKLASSQTGALPFQALELLAVDENGEEDTNKKRALQKMFRPDRDNQLTLLAFVQTCDSTFKKLQYFRASVGNASVIDKVLEDIVDGMFFFIVGLFLMSIMKYNPWTLLLSITSLLVSISFALGQSVSRYVEGILLIAVRRPFDLGDRIFIASAESMMSSDVSGNTCFVEDINLTTTTLRHARTNEVSSVTNWSIAGSRIVNCNRSPLAIVYYEMKMHISILDGENLDKFESGLEQYVADNPRTWDSLAFCRHESIDADYEIVYFVIAFRHRNSWQDAARIKLNRAELLRYMHDLGKEMNVNLETPPARRLLYYGGVLENGQVEDYKKNLLNPSNIRSHGRKSDNPVGPARTPSEFEQSFAGENFDSDGDILRGE